MAAALHFVTNTLRMLSGVLIWGAHFGVVYIFTALACARRFQDLSWLGIDIVSWTVAIATVMAIAGILVILLPAWRNLYHRSPQPATPAFIDWMTVAFGGLALLAIVLEALPVMLVPIC
ncbi:hypothetical protein [Methylocaldum sp.]|uniref:hypothetical protein n=1 Tax=Methylocaldum sp. TaxID=1969727 RepID=UPI002D70673B|nr:hypothetical protein [Methylocaldum sp.]HYE35798.1 hypothetical protein [Methylocaldum sp.]